MDLFFFFSFLTIFYLLLIILFYYLDFLNFIFLLLVGLFWIFTIFFIVKSSYSLNFPLKTSCCCFSIFSPVFWGFKIVFFFFLDVFTYIELVPYELFIFCSLWSLFFFSYKAWLCICKMHHRECWEVGLLIWFHAGSLGRDLPLSVHWGLSVHFKNVYWVFGRRVYARAGRLFSICNCGREGAVSSKDLRLP